jgi:hypothetical protein
MNVDGLSLKGQPSSLIEAETAWFAEWTFEIIQTEMGETHSDADRANPERNPLHLPGFSRVLQI